MINQRKYHNFSKKCFSTNSKLVQLGCYNGHAASSGTKCAAPLAKEDGLLLLDVWVPETVG